MRPIASAVAFSGNDILVAASADHFATQEQFIRRPIHGKCRWHASVVASRVDRGHRRYGLPSLH